MTDVGVVMNPEPAVKTSSGRPGKAASLAPDPEAALNAALAAAQGEFPAIQRDKEVSVSTKTGGTYTFKYAPLDTILAAVRPVLSKNGLALTQQLVEYNDGRPGIRTELRHAAGGVIGATFPLLSAPTTPQQLGSLLTYLRRYAIVALLGVAAEEDDDGGQAADAPAAKAKPQPAERDPKYATKKQTDRLWAIAKANVVDGELLKRIITDVTGDQDPSSSRIPKEHYNAIVAQVEANAVPF
jgi:hypothetical protein